MASLVNQRQLIIAVSLVSAVCFLALAVHYNSTKFQDGATGLAQSLGRVNLAQLKARNLQLKKEVARASSFLKSLRNPSTSRESTLQALEERNAQMQDELNHIQFERAEHEHAILKQELMQARQMASPRFNYIGGQNLDQTNYKEEYASKPPGFNPLSEVTRADKLLDPNRRPPLRVTLLKSAQHTLVCLKSIYTAIVSTTHR